MKKTGAFALRMPMSLKAAVEKLSEQDGTSMNQFLVVAAAEKVAALETESFFRERKAQADQGAFLRILNREGGEPPRPGDELPDELPAIPPGE